jgi:hypothetical protein
MRIKSTGGMLATGGLVLLLGAPGAAQLEKQGTSRGVRLDVILHGP